jgi:hypothetical protein
MSGDITQELLWEIQEVVHKQASSEMRNKKATGRMSRKERDVCFFRN